MKKNASSSAGQALNFLIQGNNRFLKRLFPVNGNGDGIIKPLKLISGDQSPFCAILSCSDSRVPPEFIFDQGIGDLFIIRTAGNYASTPAIASIEYAVLKLKVPLVVVMGHNYCGEIQGALDKELAGIEFPSKNLNALANEFGSSIREAVKNNRGKENDILVNYAARHHIQRTIHSILESPVLQEAQKKNNVGIIGAFYSLNTGKVDFLLTELC